MKFTSIVSTLLLWSSSSHLLSTLVTAQDVTEACFAAATPVTLASGVTLLHFTDATNGTLSVRLTNTGNGVGWLGFAVYAGSMIGSTAIIGQPDLTGADAVAVYYLGGQGSASDQTLLNSPTLTDASVVQDADGTTVLQFTMPLVTSGAQIEPLTADGTHDFAFAYGFSNTFGYHSNRGSFSLPLVPCDPSAISGDDDNQGATKAPVVIQVAGGPKRNLWVAHGILMATAWGILVPLAIGFSMLRDLLPLPEGMWFQIHRALNTTAIACTIAAFGIAVHNLNLSGGDPMHFKMGKHRKVGFSVFMLAMVQFLVAMVRPHAPHAPAAKEEDAAKEDVEAEKEPEPVQAEEKTLLRKVWEIKHRVFATALLGLAWYNIWSGLGYYKIYYPQITNTSDLQTAAWAVIGSLSGTIVLLKIVSIVRARKSA